MFDSTINIDLFIYKLYEKLQVARRIARQQFKLDLTNFNFALT
jgi:hypothetical protein